MLGEAAVERLRSLSSLDARGGAAISHFQHRAGVVCVNCSFVWFFLKRACMGAFLELV